MNIEEQWQQDVENYGDNAYKMWELLGNVTIRLTNNKSLISWINHNPVLLKRKTSSEFPFDLERAKSGDAVEFKNISENSYTGEERIKWVTLNDVVIDDDSTVKGAFYVYNHLINIKIENCNHNEWLRMKYPPKKLIGSKL